MKISAVIITYNEAANIAKCLDAVQQVADEIIIVDSFSKDKTKTICESYNVRFFERKFDGYGEQKNWGNAQVSGDYILSLDADEILSQKLIKSILEIKKNPIFKAYYLKRLTNFDGTWVRLAGWYPDKKVRLWHKDVAIWIEKVVHEYLEVKKEITIGQAKGNVLHYSFTSVFDYLSRQNKYAKLNATERLKFGKAPRFLPNFLKGIYKFILLYFFKLGFLHGYIGFVICINGAGKYLINYAKYHQIKHSKTAGLAQIGLHSTMEKAGNYSFLNLFKIKFLVDEYRKNKIETIEFLNYNDLKLGGIAAFWAGVPNVIYYSKDKSETGLFNDFLFSTIVTQKIN